MNGARFRPKWKENLARWLAGLFLLVTTLFSIVVLTIAGAALWVPRLGRAGLARSLIAFILRGILFTLSQRRRPISYGTLRCL